MDNTGIWIDAESGDFQFDENGDIVLIHGLDMVCQCVRVTLQVYKGEWELDERHGTDYERILGIKPRPPDEIIKSIIREAVFQEDEVRRIDDIALAHDGRVMRVAISGMLKSGENFDLEVDA